MCGITGFVSPSQQDFTSIIDRMTRRLEHRGPDHQGIWIDPDVGVALGHRRLSILDLSSDGHQPMVSATGRYVVVFNGEIYNFRALRDELEHAGCTFKSRSDTEVLLASISTWGIDAALTKFNGMFAFAMWDREDRLLHLARDRVGEKPLFYGWQNGSFIFGSELKALTAFPGFEKKVDRAALSLFFRHNYIPCPRTIYQGVKKLSPGSVVSITFKGQTQEVHRKYWELSRYAQRSADVAFRASFEQASTDLESLLLDATKLRMESDVPLGAFLSGGIDSSTIVALMQSSIASKVKTFTIGFEESSFNEADHARAVAKHLGTDHTELYVTTRDALSIIPNLPQIWDEPFSDSSQIPTALLANLTRKSVTVALSGDGGDELFAGYGRYYSTVRQWESIARLPQAIRGAAAAMAPLVGRLSESVAYLQNALPSWTRAFGEKTLPQLSRGRNLLRRIGLNERLFYRQATSHWDDPSAIVEDACEPALVGEVEETWAKVDGLCNRMMFLDTLTYLPDDILVKVDRATMATGLEGRMPLLDHRVIEFAWSLPDEFKIDASWPKKILRDVLYRHVPRCLVDRKKMGFGVPIDKWLRGPLRDWAESLLNKESLSHGHLKQPSVSREWSLFLAGQASGCRVWNILMFQAWHAAQP